MNRRGFLTSILAAATAPAIVRADSLMRVRPWGEQITGMGLMLGGNHLLTIDQITREALEMFRQSNAFLMGMMQSPDYPKIQCRNFAASSIPPTR